MVGCCSKRAATATLLANFLALPCRALLLNSMPSSPTWRSSTATMQPTRHTRCAGTAASASVPPQLSQAAGQHPTIRLHRLTFRMCRVLAPASPPSTVQLELNEYADMSWQQFSKQKLGFEGGKALQRCVGSRRCCVHMQGRRRAGQQALPLPLKLQTVAHSTWLSQLTVVPLCPAVPVTQPQRTQRGCSLPLQQGRPSCCC